MKKINIAELLKDCPKGMELDCLLYDNVTLVSVDDVEPTTFPIKVLRSNGCEIILTEYGQYAYTDDAKCIIFPKGKTTWEGFVPPCKFVDGDIISNGHYIAIFYKTGKPEYCVNSNMIYYHCFLNLKDCKLKAGINYGIGTIEDYKYATEEEKQKLFDAIKAIGRRWNSKTKTLEKLIEPKFKVGDRIKHKENQKWFCTIARVGDSRYYVDGHPTCYTVPFGKQDEYELFPDKFDIAILKPFDKVLVKTNIHNPVWSIDFYGGYDCEIGDSFTPFAVTGGKYFQQCIPYEGNEHLLGTTKDCDEYYKVWG